MGSHLRDSLATSNVEEALLSTGMGSKDGDSPFRLAKLERVARVDGLVGFSAMEKLLRRLGVELDGDDERLAALLPEPISKVADRSMMGRQGSLRSKTVVSLGWKGMREKEEYGPKI